MNELFDEERKVYKASQKVQPTKSVELQFRKACKKILADGKVTQEEEKQLKSLAKFFKMPNKVMKEMLADEIKIFRQGRKQAPSRKAILQFGKACRKAWADGEITAEEKTQLKELAKLCKFP